MNQQKNGGMVLNFEKKTERYQAINSNGRLYFVRNLLFTSKLKVSRIRTRRSFSIHRVDELEQQQQQQFIFTL